MRVLTIGNQYPQPSFGEYGRYRQDVMDRLAERGRDVVAPTGDARVDGGFEVASA